jgi:hypothetical protein
VWLKLIELLDKIVKSKIVMNCMRKTCISHFNMLVLLSHYKYTTVCVTNLGLPVDGRAHIIYVAAAPAVGMHSIRSSERAAKIDWHASSPRWLPSLEGNATRGLGRRIKNMRFKCELGKSKHAMGTALFERLGFTVTSTFVSESNKTYTHNYT